MKGLSDLNSVIDTTPTLDKHAVIRTTVPRFLGMGF